jgi:hypothetical protein
MRPNHKENVKRALTDSLKIVRRLNVENVRIEDLAEEYDVSRPVIEAIWHGGSTPAERQAARMRKLHHKQPKPRQQTVGRVPLDALRPGMSHRNIARLVGALIRGQDVVPDADVVTVLDWAKRSFNQVYPPVSQAHRELLATALTGGDIEVRDGGVHEVKRLGLASVKGSRIFSVLSASEE